MNCDAIAAPQFEVTFTAHRNSSAEREFQTARYEALAARLSDFSSMPDTPRVTSSGCAETGVVQGVLSDFAEHCLLGR